MVLENSQKLLNFIGLTNQSAIVFWQWKIPSVVVKYFCVLNLMTAVASESALLYEIHNIFQHVNSITFVFLSIMQLFLIYVFDFMRNYVLIQKAIDQLDEFVAKSESKIKEKEKSVFLNLFYLCTGLSTDKSLNGFYGTAEHQDISLTKKFMAYTVCIFFSTYVPPALFPISYTIMDYPNPDDWFLPHQAR